MKQLIFLFTLSLPFFAQAQFKASADFVSGIDYSYRRLNPDNSNSIISIAESRNKTEIPRLGMRIGANLNFKLSSKLFLKTGLRYVSNGYSTKKRSLQFESQYDPVTGQIITDPTLIQTIEYKTNYRFVEIPLSLRYVFRDKKFSYFVESGLGFANYINSFKIITTDLGKSTNESKPDFFSAWNANAILSLGAQYAISKNVQLFAQPIFRYSLNPIALAPIDEHLYSLGLEAGIRCSLSRK